MMKHFDSSNRRQDRNGSALIIVLGILAVMTALAVAFSVFTRTEQGGASNLKNAVVSQMSMQTAVGRVIEAVDLSFGSPSNNWAVPIWPYPWIASSGDEADDYFQSRVLGDKESPEAHLITAEVADFLTPSQLAMARSAKIGWAPIFSSIRTEGIKGEGSTGGGIYGDSGRPSADGVIGRYAFIVFDTTGLLDMNLAGSDDGKYDGDKREEDHGENPRTWMLPDQDTTDGNDNPIRLALTDSDKFVSARKKANPSSTYEVPFSSFADLRTWGTSGKTIDLHGEKATKGAYEAFDFSLPPYWNGVSNALTDTNFQTRYFPPDLFSTFSLSLEALDPDGLPKVVLPTQEELDKGLSQKAAQAFGAQTLRAMTKVFANSRAMNGEAGDESKDTYTFFAKSSKPMKVTRARLATVALIDAMDGDVAPGVWSKSGSSSPIFQPWQALPDLSDVETSVVNADGVRSNVTVDDKLDATQAQKSNPLNFPATEPVPLLSEVYAYVEINKPAKADFKFVYDDDGNGVGENSYVTIRGNLIIGGRAQLLNAALAENATELDYSLSVDCELLTSTPEDSAVTRVGKEDDVLLDLMSDAEEDVFGGKSSAHQTWKIDGKSLSETDNHCIALSIPGDSSRLSDKESTSSSGNYVPKLSFEKSFPIEIKCMAKSWPDDNGGGVFGDHPQNAPAEDDGIGISGKIAGEPDWLFYPLTAAEENKGDDVFLPIRLKTTIKQGSTTVQQIPAPFLESDEKKGWWIRVNAGIYHPKTSKNFAGKKDGEPWERSYASGWAVCPDPAFGFDTSSMSLKGALGDNGVVAWFNDSVTRIEAAEGGDSVFGGGGEDDNWADLRDYMQKSENHDENLLSGSSSAFSYLVKEWLLREGDYENAWNYITPKLDVVPDILHGPSRSSKPFRATFGLNDNQLKTRIQNAAFKSVGELGNVRIGPLYETLSTMRSFRSGGEKPSKSDFHRVLDYFSVVPNRYPASDDSSVKIASDGDVDYSSCTELFSGALAGRVNLNMPPVLRWSSRQGRRVSVTNLRNPYPFITAILGAKCSSTGQTIDFALAESIANAICDYGGEEIENKYGFNGSTPSRYVFQRLSDLGNASDGENNVLLEEIVAALEKMTPKPTLDSDREAFIANSSNAFSTRGQTYLAVIRADAYMPRYGDEASATSGSTLSSCTAVVELFRDSEFARYPDGEPLTDSKKNPVFFHNWYIRSLRVF